VPALHPIAALQGRIASYYTGRIERFGPCPAGVDWPSERNQRVRFVQLLRICDFSRPLSLNDLGCGYGALYGHLRREHPGAVVDYKGFDLSAAMVQSARSVWRKHPDAVFEVGDLGRAADYCVASGIFNVRLDEPLRLWETFVADTLHSMAASSRWGFAVNFLKPLPIGTDPAPELYRPSPARWARFCADGLGAAVEVLTAYGLREVTLLVRTEGARLRP